MVLGTSVKPIEVIQIYTTRSGVEAAKVGNVWVPFNSLTDKPGKYYKGIVRKEIGHIESRLSYSETEISELDQAIKANDKDKLRELLRFERNATNSLLSKPDELAQFIERVKKDKRKRIGERQEELKNLRELLK